MSRHLITGGAGFIGSALAHRLVNEGHAVTVLDRFSRGKHDRVPHRARTIHADIRDRDAVHAAHDRLATASETEPLRRRVAALEAMRRPPTSRRIR